MFEHVEHYPGDPILSLVNDFIADEREKKVNLSIGYYYDESGSVPELTSVKKAVEAQSAKHFAPTYLPMSGMKSYTEAVKTLLFGENCLASHKDRITTIQTLGGSGALKVGADFLFSHFKDSQVWVSDPTWENHIAIFKGAGFTVNKYPYYDSKTHGVNFDAMINTFESLPKQSIVLLHPCCHNPTGADLTQAQWDAIIDVIKQKELIAFMDIAYQGFGQGIDEDAYAIRAFTNANLCGLVANSFSKTFSLYSERVGGLSIICDDELTAKKVLGQLEFSVRKIYSSPPATGAKIVNHILNDANLNVLWQQEVNAMRDRIKKMRSNLHAALKDSVPERNFDFLLNQQGMFSYTGFTKNQVENLKNHYGVYLVGSGRMCVAGLRSDNLHQVTVAFSVA